MAEKREIFRKQSLEKLSSPDRLDQLLRVVKPQSWLLLIAFAGGLGLALTWGILGRIPITVGGQAVLVRPKQVVSFQSPASGPISSLLVQVGQEVEKGELLGRLHLPELAQEIASERLKLEQFQQKTGKLTELGRQQALEEKRLLQEEQGLVESRIEIVQTTAERIKERNDAYFAQQQRSIDTARELSLELGEALDERFRAYQNLGEKDLIGDDVVVDAQSRLIDNRLRLAELDVQSDALRLRENLAQETYDEQLDLVRQLEIQLVDIRLREMAIDKSLAEDALESESGRQDIERRIEQLTLRLDVESEIRSEYTGRVLEVTAVVGEHVTPGFRLGKMEIEDKDAQLMALAYFRVEDGKKVQPDMRMRVSPDNVQKERHGSIVGSVERVSAYAVSTEAAATVIGNLEMARALLGGRHSIEVRARLDTDPASFSGFRWTSGEGPPGVTVTPGTTANVRVTIEERAPITLVLPFLRSLMSSE